MVVVAGWQVEAHKLGGGRSPTREVVEELATELADTIAECHRHALKTYKTKQRHGAYTQHGIHMAYTQPRNTPETGGWKKPPPELPPMSVALVPEADEGRSP